MALLLIVIIAGSTAASIYIITRPNAQGFALSIYPSQLRGDAIAGQMVIYLVTVADNASEQTGGSIKLTASAAGLPVSVYPEAILPGQVAEVTVVPNVEAVGSNITVSVGGERGGLTHTQTVVFTVVPGEEGRIDRARQLRDIFVQWLQAAHPELGITNQTDWMGTIVSPHWLIVEHYLFLSKDWEMHVYWHVMIPPYDWARIDLRHRGTEIAPSLSFEISSLNASLPPQAITPPETAWR